LLVRYVDQLAVSHGVPVVEVTFQADGSNELLVMQRAKVLATTRKSVILQQDEKSNEIIKVGPAELMEKEAAIHAVVDGGPNIRRLVSTGVVGGLQHASGRPPLRFVALKGLGGPLGSQHVDNMASLFTQASNALQHLHDKDVFHRDIKPSNMIVIEGELQLNDFDCSCFAQSKEECKNLNVGTPFFSSPFLARTYTPGDDWAALVLSFLSLRLDIADKKDVLKQATGLDWVPEVVKSCIATHHLSTG
jgi:serine/threonine protein kinase